MTWSLLRPESWRLPWRAPDTSTEARECLRRLEAHDADVARLAAELSEAQRRNHFSSMVAAAIARGAREGGR